MSTIVSKKSERVDSAPTTQLHDMLVEEVLTDTIVVPAGRRAIDPNWVETLAEDIAENGQRTPIEIVKTKNGFRLISGAHRLAAIVKISGNAIFAVVREPEEFASDADMKLREIAENFMRRELSVLDRAMDVSAWREIYEAAHGAVKRGGDRRKKQQFQVGTIISDDIAEEHSAKFALCFSEASQKALRIGRRSVFNALKISTISANARSQIALLSIADNQSELLALAAQGPERQQVIAALISAGDVANVASAIAQIDNAPRPVALSPYARISEKFSRMKPTEQNQFFDLHAEAIELWLERRGK